VTIRFGSRVFEPRAFTTLLALALVAALVALGRWQLHRADEKQALYTLFDLGKDATRVVDAATPRLPRYQHAQALGAYDSARQILIDNMSSAEGRAGYFVITPFALHGGGWILVNRGWVPVGASRAAKPAVAVPTEEREIRGRADELPQAGMQLGTRLPLAPPYPVVASFPTHTEIAALLGERAWAPAANLLLLDPSEPDGFLRQWQPPGFPPIRHIAYAVQWFALAAGLVVIYLATNLRRAERKPV
jgi:surfeit locus 1 family protein